MRKTVVFVGCFTSTVWANGTMLSMVVNVEYCWLVKNVIGNNLSVGCKGVKWWGEEVCGKVRLLMLDSRELRELLEKLEFLDPLEFELTLLLEELLLMLLPDWVLLLLLLVLAVPWLGKAAAPSAEGKFDGRKGS